MMLAKALASASASAPKVYVEDVFSTWLYTGNGSTQTITNGIDLSGKGGLVWLKERSVSGSNHHLVDSARGVRNSLYTNSSAQQFNLSSTGPFSPFGSVSQFNSNGFFIDGPGATANGVNNSSTTYASWTFRKAAKFFDVVTYTGSGSAGKVINHNLGSTPGVIILKRTDTTANWVFWHRTFNGSQYLYLNTTDSLLNDSPVVNFSNVGSSSFQIDSTWASTNASGGTYVAYLFAHDAGGFGDSGNDSVVKCGSFTTPSSGSIDVDLGWEPQWLLVKASSNTGGWFLFDNMRGWAVGSNDQVLQAHLSDAEFSGGYGNPIATGFTTAGLNSSQTYIYIAIRRGPMKTPTDATKVFSAITNTGNGNFTTGQILTTGFPVDLAYVKYRTGTFDALVDRLRGITAPLAIGTPHLRPTATIAEGLSNDFGGGDSNTSYVVGQASSQTTINYAFRRAPGFFDVVAYTGTGSTTDNPVSHNLRVAPELILCKKRSASGNNWPVYQKDFTIPSNGGYGWLNNNSAFVTASNFYYLWGKTTPTATTFYVSTDGGAGNTNDAGATYIAYLFASCPGVSKVGSYTGTGTTLNVDCGFTNGCRFVLIKRVDSTGDWYVWDTARGIVSGDDPYLLLNSTAAEVTNTDYIDPLSSGFQISSTAPAAINANGGSFIYLAIA